MIILIAGGVNNGKSHKARQLTKYLAGRDNIMPYHINTIRHTDQSVTEHIHRSKELSSKEGFTIIEQTEDIDKITENRDLHGAFMLDSLTALVINEMIVKNSIPVYHEQHILDGLNKLINSDISHLIMTSDYIFSNPNKLDDETDNYIRALGRMNLEISKIADCVIEVCYDNLLIHKGKSLLAGYTSSQRASAI